MSSIVAICAAGDRAEAEKLSMSLRALGAQIDVVTLEEAANMDRDVILDNDYSAVIILWSATSIADKRIAPYAKSALASDLLASVSLDGVTPNEEFLGKDLADLSGWDGSRSHKEFQLLVRVLVGIVHGRAAAGEVPVNGNTVLSRDDFPPKARLKRHFGPFKSPMVLFTVALILLEYFVDFVDLGSVIGEQWELLIATVALVAAFFEVAEDHLVERIRRRIVRKIAGVRVSDEISRPANAASAFLDVFEGAFGAKHFSPRCYLISTIWSLLFYGLLLMLMTDFGLIQTGVGKLFALDIDRPDDPSWITVGQTTAEANAALLFLAIPIFNTFTDFFSLLQTRELLKRASRYRRVFPFVLLDAIMTFAIFLVCVALGPVVVLFVVDLLTAELTGNTFQAIGELVREIYSALFALFGPGWRGELSSALAGEANLTTTTLVIAMITTFTTSIWLWACWVLSLIMPLFPRGWLRSRRKPIAILGAVISLLVFACVGGVRAIETRLRTVDLETAHAGEVFRDDCEHCPEMVYIPGGDFVMGGGESSATSRSVGGPPHTVRVPAFALGRLEVSFREWDACVEATQGETTGCRPIPSNGDFSSGDQGWGRGLRPVVTVSWYDARSYVRWLNSQVEGDPYRLPTEAEWEYAARAGATGPYFFDAEKEVLCDFMNGADRALVAFISDKQGYACDDGYVATAPVGTYKANPWGLYDVLGNVMEWTRDCWHSSYRRAPSDGSAWMGTDHGDCDKAVLRGGAWDDGLLQLRSTVRKRHDRGGQAYNIGFRVARDVAPR